MESSFWSLADNALLLKMIQADAKHADVAPRLFDIGSEGREIAGRLLDLAKSVLEDRVLFPGALVFPQPLTPHKTFR